MEPQSRSMVVSLLLNHMPLKFLLRASSFMIIMLLLSQYQLLWMHPLPQMLLLMIWLLGFPVDFCLIWTLEAVMEFLPLNLFCDTQSEHLKESTKTILKNYLHCIIGTRCKLLAWYMCCKKDPATVKRWLVLELNTYCTCCWSPNNSVNLSVCRISPLFKVLSC